MEYALLIYEDPQDTAARDDPDRQAQYWAGWMSYGQAIGAAGVVRAGAPLHPSTTATTVRAGGGREVQDGPYADTKEQLGGFFVIDVPDLDAALAWAARAPNGVIEVRPVLKREMPAQVETAEAAAA